MSLTITSGLIQVTDRADKLKFTSNGRTPIVLYRGRFNLWQWFEFPRLKWPGSYSTGGTVNSHESTDTLLLANKGTEYTETPHFILGNLRFSDNFGTTHNTIAGSKQHLALSFLLPDTHQSYNATIDVVAGIGFILYHNLYLDNNGNARMEFRFVQASTVSYDPRHNLGALENSHVGTLPLARYEMPWEYRRYDGTGTLDFVVGTFIG